ncbi:peptidase inhibitor family I36 protein [Kitasatospora sp. NPDC088134]|uniref:peptidase inhibitor family I36 protein n=1 Tax=Kitasatospora sp. NPDC088134 TaxID=3364071 RepID=UPI0037FDB836
MTAPSASASASDCDNGGNPEVCLFDDANYAGLRFARDAYWNPWVTTYNLSDSGYNDRMSSWINNGRHDARWFSDANAKGDTRCMNSHSFNSYVGWYDNDEASSIQVYTDDRAC